MMKNREWLHELIDQMLDDGKMGKVCEIHVNDRGVRMNIPYNIPYAEYKELRDRTRRPEFFGKIQVNYHAGSPHSVNIIDSVTEEKYKEGKMLDKE